MTSSRSDITRRELIAATGFAAGSLLLPGVRAAGAQTPQQTPALEELVIDLPGAPVSINPFLAYSARDWSVVHSIYDSPVGFAPDGQIMPLAAASFESADGVTFEVVLRKGLTFHDGTPVDGNAVKRSVTAIQASDSQAVGLFAGIKSVQVDGLQATIVCDTPSPWLPAQIAVWMVLIPESWTPENALTAPVGSGPFKYKSEEAGSSITLVQNEAYASDSLKGQALARRVVYRYVPEIGTRVADLTSGTADVITELDADQHDAVSNGGGTVIDVPIVATTFVRIANDTAPFDDERVRQALNYAVDVESIAQALVSKGSHRLASLYPDERALGFDPDLAAYAYDPDKAKSLLAEAGVEDGLRVDLQVSSNGRQDVGEAIAAQLGEIGLEVTVVRTELGTFNGQWKDTAAPALRMVSWGPMYDPQTLLNLVFSSKGFLSRFIDPEVDRLIDAGAKETDRAKRRDVYRELGARMNATAPAIFLWNPVSMYGVSADAAGWQPRGDDYVIATSVLS